MSTYAANATKHVAPLGLKAESNSPVTDMSAIVGARLPCPMGWGTQPLRVPTVG